MSANAIRRIAKVLVFSASTLPLVFLFWDAFTRQPDLVYFNGIVKNTGFWSLRFLCLTLAITPLRWLTGWHVLIKFRRQMGLFGFFYGVVHTAAYIILDRVASLDPGARAGLLLAAAQTTSAVLVDLQRPFFWIGLTALLLMMPLAVTSTAGMIRRMTGRRWQSLHRLVYPAAIAGVLHTYWPLTLPVRRYMIILAIIFAFRIVRAYAKTSTMIPAMSKRFYASIVLIVVSAAVIAAAQQPQRPSKFHLQEATIADIQRAIQTNQITTVNLVQLYLKRVKAYNNTCVNEPMGILGPITTIANAKQINALSTLNLRPANRKAWGFDDRKARSLTDAADSNPNMPDALEVAAAQDRQFKQTGRLAGPLHGVVMAIKDQYDTFDLRTTSGADADYANDRPPEDATFVTRLRAAGAIILGKANLAEYAVDGARSSFGGTFCNPYDTEREPGMSSAGSATSVAANLVTCAIGEETVVSIRWPSAVNSLVGLAPTEELVSRKGMMGAGLTMRTGPICRTAQDAARILDVIAGYDAKDELTVFSVGRTPSKSYASFASAQRLDGVRIGVIREYMSKKLFSKADEESIDIAEQAISDLRKLGATIVDPGPEGELFKNCISRYAPELQAGSNQIAALLEMHANPERAPKELSLRTLNSLGVQGEGKYMIDRYLQERGDANIKTNADLIAKARFYNDRNFPDRKLAREQAERATTLDTSARLQTRFAIQNVLLQCMQEQRLDALMSPMSTVPPRKLTNPREPVANGRNAIGWSLIGQQGFPAITVPAGFTTEVWDRVGEPGGGTHLVGPVKASLPVGVDFLARPFDEALLFRIASAYERATHHRRPPPDFGPLAGEP